MSVIAILGGTLALMSGVCLFILVHDLRDIHIRIWSSTLGSHDVADQKGKRPCEVE